MICYPSQGQSRSLNLGGKLSLQRKRSHPIKRLLSKVATAVWAIMTVKVVHTKGKNVTTVTKPVIFKGPVKPRKGRHRVPDPQLIIWTVMIEIVMTTEDPLRFITWTTRIASYGSALGYREG